MPVWAATGPTSIALGPDGNLYVGFQKSGNVVRVTNPQALSFDPNFPQIVQSVRHIAQRAADPRPGVCGT